MLLGPINSQTMLPSLLLTLSTWPSLSPLKRSCPFANSYLLLVVMLAVLRSLPTRTTTVALPLPPTTLPPLIRSTSTYVRYYYIRDLVKLGAISIVWCPTEDMLADNLTKFSLPSSIHLIKHARSMLSGTYFGHGPVSVPRGSVGTLYPCLPMYMVYPLYFSRIPMHFCHSFWTFQTVH